MTGFVSNGNATPQVLEYIRPWTDLYKVDLKSFNDREYRQLGGRIRRAWRASRADGLAGALRVLRLCAAFSIVPAAVPLCFRFRLVCAIS